MPRKPRRKAVISEAPIQGAGVGTTGVHGVSPVTVERLACSLRSVNIGSERRTGKQGDSGNKGSGSGTTVGQGAAMERRDKVQECCVKTIKPDHSLQSKKAVIADTPKEHAKKQKRPPKSQRANKNPKGNNIEFWNDIISRSLRDVVNKPVNLKSRDLDRHMSGLGPLRFDRMLVADFICSSCNKHWDSTQVTVEVEYEAKKVNFQGIIKMKEYGQRCRRCHAKFEVPAFDKESAEHMGTKLREKILVKYYGVAAPKCDVWAGHTRRDRKNPHDKANCEACHKGTCRAEEKTSDSPFSNSPRMEAGSVKFTNTTITWKLSVGGKISTIG
eukprot:GFUD01008626.1.p1 GENE.GFUD01008626.1~~GFUD01008626.1.p1  ORF type:complete len:329 (+),score=82.67 GFUD01008626.1:108-1094(+)